jgi:hypothetical protein
MQIIMSIKKEADSEFMKAFLIWRLLVFGSKKSVHRINRYQEKTENNDHFLKNPKFSTEFLQIGLSWSKQLRFSYFFYKNIQN